MMNTYRSLAWVALFLSSFLLNSSSTAQATVFAWKGEGGALHLSNDPEEVPAIHRASARQFTSKFAGTSVPDNPPPTSSSPLEPTSAYERGVESGLLAAERQLAMTNELLKTTLQGVRQPAPPPSIVIIQRPSDPIVRYVDRAPSTLPYYGFISPYSWYWGVPYAYHYQYGFSRGRFVPHSHFFPGTRRQNSGLFFPYGHSSHHGFLSGHGLVAR